MKKLFSTIILLTFSLPAFAGKVPESFADLAEKLSPTVVNISTTQTINSPFKSMRDKFRGQPNMNELDDLLERFLGPNLGDRKTQSLGSGFIIDSSGYIVTNSHVTEGAEEITVTLHDDAQYKAEIIGSDKKTDLALLKIKPAKPLPYAKFGNSDKSRVGDWVVVIGNPFGLGGTVTTGIISARSRDINSGPFDNYIQTDAAINRGNSGGPMFNLDGTVIGINTAIFSPNGGGNVGIGFAVPSNMANNIISQLKENGSIKRGWLGVKIQTVTEEIAESIGLEDQKGALVAEIMKDSPADNSDIKVGDIIIRFDGKEITTMKTLPRVVAETDIGKKVKVEVIRGGKRENFKVTIAKLDEGENKTNEKSNLKNRDDKKEDTLGLSLSPLNDSLKQKHRIDKGVKGVLVENVHPDSISAERGISKGDIIIEANRKKLLSEKDFSNIVKRALKNKKKAVLLLIHKRGESIFIAIPVKKD